jgi:hypothetical protein
MSDEPCSRRGEMVRPGFFRCSSNRIVHTEPGVVPLSTCGICPYRNLPDHDGLPEQKPDPRYTMPCAHIGPAIAEGICNACGMKGQPFQIFACDLHVKCMVKRYRSDRPDLKVCFNCDDYVPRDPPPDEPPPVPLALEATSQPKRRDPIMPLGDPEFASKTMHNVAGRNPEQ